MKYLNSAISFYLGGLFAFCTIGGAQGGLILIDYLMWPVTSTIIASLMILGLLI